MTISPAVIIILIYSSTFDVYNNNNNNNNNNKYVSNIPGKHEVKELKKTAILGTAHTLRKVQ